MNPLPATSGPLVPRKRQPVEAKGGFPPKHEPASRENAWGEVGAYEGGSERLSGIWSGFEHGGSPFSSRRRPSDHPTGFTAHKPAAAAHARRHGHARPAPRYAA